MTEIEIIKNPWDEKFYDLISDVKTNFYFTSPFISDEPVKNLLNKLNKDVEIKGLTFLNFKSIRSNFLSINSLKRIENRGKIKTSKRFLHSKIYIFDNEKAIITSANLTLAGLRNNYEYGILIKEKKIVTKIIKDFNILFDGDEFSLITEKKLLEIEKYLNKLPIILDENKNNYKIKFDLEYEDKISNEDKSIIYKNLKGWKKEVFEVIDTKLPEIFTLKDINKFKEIFKKKYPKNNFVDDKIRQQLQYLRDLGLLEFMDKGLYRRLW